METVTINGKTYKAVADPTEKQKRPVPFKVGDKVFIRTVTHYYTGEIVNIVGQWIVLSSAAWIADTGRFNNFLTEGKCNEYEGFPETVTIPMSSIIDVSPWRHALFVGQK